MNKKTLILLAALLAAVIITVIVIVVSVSSSGNPSADMTFAAATVEPLPTESPEEVMAYYESYGNVISKTPVMESEKIRTEAEAMAMLLERGFDQYPVSCPLNVDGTGQWDAVASADSAARHPVYETKYETKDRILWHVYLNGDCVLAASTVINVRAGTSVIYSEQEHVISYDTNTESFYEIDPHTSGQELRVVGRIDAELLEAVTAGEGAAQ